MVLAVRGDFNDFAAQRPRNGRIFALGVDDDNIVVGRERNVSDGIFHCHGFTRTGHAEIERMGRDQPLAVANQQVFGDSIDPIV